MRVLLVVIVTWKSKANSQFNRYWTADYELSLAKLVNVRKEFVQHIWDPRKQKWKKYFFQKRVKKVSCPQRNLVKILFCPKTFVSEKRWLSFSCIGNSTPIHLVLENDRNHKQSKLWQTYFVLSFKSNNHEMEQNSTEYMIL